MVSGGSRAERDLGACLVGVRCTHKQYGPLLGHLPTASGVHLAEEELDQHGEGPQECIVDVFVHVPDFLLLLGRHVAWWGKQSLAEEWACAKTADGISVGGRTQTGLGAGCGMARCFSHCRRRPRPLGLHSQRSRAPRGFAALYFQRLRVMGAARYQQSGHDTPDGAAALVWPWMYCCETIDEDRGGPTAVLWIVMGVVRRYSCC